MNAKAALVLLSAVAFLAIVEKTAGEGAGAKPDMDAIFKKGDTNHDNFLTLDEAKALVKQYNVPEAEIESNFKKADTDHDGKLSLAEWKAAAPGIIALVNSLKG